MNYISVIFALFLTGVATHCNAGGTPQSCIDADGVSVQVLGSGGPIADDGRASAGYLVWIDGSARFMIDTGGGTFLRFGQSGARFEDLEHIGISHFHTDHSADLVALLKSGYFSNRTRSLSISGPAKGGAYPGLSTYLERLIGDHSGSYAYLAGYLDGTADLVELIQTTVDPQQPAQLVYKNNTYDMDVYAIGVPHGPVPALAYRIRVGEQSIVFSGDQNGSSEAFLEFARDADVLVMHMPVPEDIGRVGRNLHAPPSLIGSIAKKTGAGKLVLSHFMSRSLRNIKQNLAEIKLGYDGPVISADDLMCIPVKH